MKSELKAKLLQHLLKKNGNKGFTLIELLVVIIIIGILAAIALPSFLNQANKAKQSEAKTYVGSMNRAQQAYYLEKNEFADQANFANLGLGIEDQTENYSYQITRGSGGTDDPFKGTNQARPDGAANSVLKAYIGGFGIGEATGTGEATTLAVLCEGISAPLNGGPLGDEDASFSANAAGQATVPACPIADDYEPIN